MLVNQELTRMVLELVSSRTVLIVRLMLALLSCTLLFQKATTTDRNLVPTRKLKNNHQ